LNFDKSICQNSSACEWLRHALLESGEVSREFFDEFDARHHRIDNKLMNLAKALSKNMAWQ
jgi:hypothetical protein